MTWNTPTNVSTGNALTALLWNNLLGASGSLKYLYDEVTNLKIKRHVVLHKSTNSVFGAAGSLDIAFDTIVTDYAGQQSNFPIITPVTNIPIPASGMYIAVYQLRATVNAFIRSNFFYENAGTTRQFTQSVTPVANVLFTHAIAFYAPNGSGTLKLSTQVNNGVTITAVAPSATDGSQVLTITRI